MVSESDSEGICSVSWVVVKGRLLKAKVRFLLWNAWQERNVNEPFMEKGNRRYWWGGGMSISAISEHEQETMKTQEKILQKLFLRAADNKKERGNSLSPNQW